MWFDGLGVFGIYEDPFIMAIVNTSMLRANTLKLDPTRLIDISILKS